MQYNEYTVTLHPLHYGVGYTDVQRQSIASAISERLTRQFPGLIIQISERFGNPTPTRGPDPKIIDHIDGATVAAFHEVISASRTATGQAST